MFCAREARSKSRSPLETRSRALGGDSWVPLEKPFLFLFFSIGKIVWTFIVYFIFIFAIEKQHLQDNAALCFLCFLSFLCFLLRFASCRFLEFFNTKKVSMAVQHDSRVFPCSKVNCQETWRDEEEEVRTNIYGPMMQQWNRIW